EAAPIDPTVVFYEQPVHFAPHFRFAKYFWPIFHAIAPERFRQKYRKTFVFVSRVITGKRHPSSIARLRENHARDVRTFHDRCAFPSRGTGFAMLLRQPPR